MTDDADKEVEEVEVHTGGWQHWEHLYQPWSPVEFTPIPVPWARPVYGVDIDTVDLKYPVCAPSAYAAEMVGNVLVALVVQRQAGER